MRSSLSARWPDGDALGLQFAHGAHPGPAHDPDRGRGQRDDAGEPDREERRVVHEPAGHREQDRQHRKGLTGAGEHSRVSLPRAASARGPT